MSNLHDYLEKTIPFEDVDHAIKIAKYMISEHSGTHSKGYSGLSREKIERDLRGREIPEIDFDRVFPTMISLSHIISRRNDHYIPSSHISRNFGSKSLKKSRHH